MRKMISRILVGIIAFFILVFTVFYVLNLGDSNVTEPAPDALHLIGFIALIPMISATGGRFADRKIRYIKNSEYFKPATIGIFIITYLSLIPWTLTFFIDSRLIIYMDWSVVLTSMFLSFFMFSLLLYVFTRN